MNWRSRSRREKCLGLVLVLCPDMDTAGQGVEEGKGIGRGTSSLTKIPGPQIHEVHECPLHNLLLPASLVLATLNQNDCHPWSDSPLNRPRPHPLTLTRWFPLPEMTFDLSPTLSPT